MKLRTKYLLFVGILHLITISLTFIIFRDNKVLFIISEVFVLISLWLSWLLYQQLIQPLKTLLQGINAIKDQDFNVKFRATGKLEVDQLIGVYNHMIDSLRSERTLQEEQHSFLEKLISTSPTGVIIMGFDHNIEHLNPKAMELLGITENEGLQKQIEKGNHILIKEIKELKAGESRIVSISGVETYKCQKSSFIDRGFQRYFVMLSELSIEILQTEKKAYGKVIRMMAHEVNNTVGPVNSILSFARDTDARSTHPNSDLINALEVAISRNNNLNTFMRNFAKVVRLPLPNKQPANLSEMLISASRLFELKAKEENIHLELVLPPQTVTADLDVQQMEQVIINIIKNSFEALEGSPGKEIKIMLTTDPAKLVVRDTGCGISPDAENKLFTPFYSTKKEGQGVGLTLIREILINHSFRFSLKTAKDGYTDFAIFF